MEENDNLQSRREFLKSLAKGIAVTTLFFVGGKDLVAATINNASSKCSSSYECAGGGGKCGS